MAVGPVKQRLTRLADLVTREFSELLSAPPQLLETRLRLRLRDGSYVDIRYPIDSEYSIHWQRKQGMYRWNTAPHHQGAQSYPRHVHYGTEGDVREDDMTDDNASPEDRLRKILAWIKSVIASESRQ